MDPLVEPQRLTTNTRYAVAIRRAVGSIDVSDLLNSAKHAIVPQEPTWERFFWELKHFTSS